jgi:hypothetical protein
MDLTVGKKLDRVTGTWMDPEAYDAMRAEYEERAFQRRGNQGQLSAPMVILDGHKPVMSMTNGQMYDSKSALRAEYKRAGVVEVGNDVPMKKAAPSRDERDRVKKERRAAVGKALSKMGFGA